MDVAEPKRILYVITKADWGGAQRYVFDMALTARKAGHDVLVASGTSGPLIDRLEAVGIRTETIAGMKRDISLKDELRSFRALRALIRGFRPDVMHVNSSKASGLAALAGRLARVRRIVFTAHGWAFNENRPAWQKAAIAFLHWITVMLSHVTVCVSEAIRKDAAWMPLARKRLQVIHNGIDAVELLSRSEARSRIGPDLAHMFPGALWIGTIAELHPTKGLDTLIEAFSRLIRSHPSAVLVIMGDGEEWNRLHKLIQIHDLAGRVALPGFVADAAAHLSALDIFALPSRSEALGYALLEAGQASLPAAASAVGGIPEILEDGATGLLVPPGDARALEEALARLLLSPEARERLGTALHARVRAEFSKSAMAEKTLALYSSNGASSTGKE